MTRKIGHSRPAGADAIIDWLDGGNTNRFQLSAPWSGIIYWDYGAQCCGANRLSVAMPADFLDSWKIISVIKRPNSTGDISINNSSIATSASLTAQFTLSSSTATLFIGGSFDGGLYKGYIGEIIIYRRALSDFERLEVTKYLSKKWGIKIN